MLTIDRFKPALSVRVLRLLFLGVALVLSYELARRAIPQYFPRDWQNAHEFDALADWKGARLFLLGKSPYTPEGLAFMHQDGMGHPPTTPFWYLPLAEFDKAVVAQLSAALLLVLLPLHAFLCAKELKYPLPLATALLVSCAVTATSWLPYHFDAVQFSEPIAFLYVLSWLLLRRNRDGLAGMFLGAALTIKLFPGVLLLMLLVARRFRAVFVATGTYLAVAAFMTRGFGLKSWFDFFKQQDPIAHQWLGSLQNSSLPGLVVRLLTPSCVGQGHPSKLATLISTACSLVILALAFWASRAQLREMRAGNARAIDLPFALFGLLSVFLNAWAWEHYFVLTIQPLFIVLASFCATWWAGLRRWCDDEYSSRRMVSVSLVALLGIAGIALTMRVLNVEIHERWVMPGLWFSQHLPFYHHQLHFLEATNVGAWVLPILLCFTALALSRYVERALPSQTAAPADPPSSTFA